MNTGEKWLSVAQLAEWVRGAAVGELGRGLRGVGELDRAGPDQMSFLSNPRYASLLSGSKAGAILLPRDFKPPPAGTYIFCENVERALALALALFAADPLRPEAGVDPWARVDASARVDPTARIGPFAVVGPMCRVGARTTLYPGVYLGSRATIGDECDLGPNVLVADGCSIGNRVVVKAGAVIGGPGFGFYLYNGRLERFPHIGTVIVEDDVEIGSCSCVDRAKFSETRIGRGSKIDNLVQVAHNVQLGCNVILAGQTGLGGSCEIGDNAVLGGRTGVIDHVTLGAGVMIAAGSIVYHDVAAGETQLGIPAEPVAQQRRIWSALKRLPELLQDFRALAARVTHLEASTDNRKRN